MAQTRVHTSQVAYAGPLRLHAAPSSSTTDLPTRRRLKWCDGSSSSEDNTLPVQPDDEILVEDLRVGGPILCCLPADVFPITATDAVTSVFNSELRGPIMQEIQTSGIGFEAMSVIKRRWRNSYGPPTPVILISAQQKSPVDTTWPLLCRKIREICVSAGHIDLDVEISDPLAYMPILSYPVGPNDRIVHIWPSLKERILKILNGQRWHTLDVLRRGREDEERIITIIVTIREISGIVSRHWSGMRDRIVDVIDSVGLEDIAVEIARGDIYPQDTHDANVLDECDWNRKARFGGSLATFRNTKRGGTFGGFVVLDFPDLSSKTYGLTCFHCVVNEDTPKPERDRWEQKGIKPGDSANRIKLSHPSQRDHDNMMTQYSGILEGHRTPEYYELEKLASEPDAFLIPSQQKLLEIKRKCIAKLEHQIRTAEEFMKDGENDFGTVYAASGLRLAESNSSLDWALIEVDEGRISSNKLSPEVVSMYSAFNPISGTHVTEASFMLDTNIPVFKLGRSTGFTKGMINGIETTTLLSWTLGGPSGDMPTQKCGQDWVIAPSHEDGSSARGDFSARGDSGAFVLDKYGRFIGLLLSGNLHCSISYMTSASDLFQDIKEITGASNVRIHQAED
ncbi:hypothetical protein MauCBS54593_000803 [Microsporum audouinii]